MTSRRSRHEGLDTPQHFHVHDDEHDGFEKDISEINSKLDKVLWALVSATFTGGGAIVVWAVQLAAAE